ncbi:MAG: ribosome biogenesis GTPase Der [Magnetococcales bacterium]|nr:ribosome biogenesis GTPase Der [Magnetococcales bacterium]
MNEEPCLVEPRPPQAPPLIALVGRPNVGKSTLFNRLTRSRDALVDDMPGVTRDRQYGRGVWDGRPFRVVDTGGMQEKSDDPLARDVRQQALVAIEEADAIVLVTDGVTGVLPDDRAIAGELRRAQKPVVCAVNKSEGRKGSDGVWEFFELAAGPVLPIAATHGQGVDDLLAALFTALPAPEMLEPIDMPAEEESNLPLRVAIIGAPNAGKSSLINALLGEERFVASAIPGTTRDSVDTPFTAADGRDYILVDTAGLRRKSRVTQRVESFSAIAALKAIDRAQVAVLVIDGDRGVTEQDQRVAGYAVEAGCGLVVAINKWDLAGRPADALTQSRDQIALAFPRLEHVPVLRLSAATGRGLDRLLPAVARVGDACRQRINTGVLNRWLAEVLAQHPPPRHGGHPVKIRYAAQVGVLPPTLLFHANHPEDIHASYRRYLENQLRQAFDFAGAPVRLLFRKTSRRE